MDTFALEFLYLHFLTICNSLSVAGHALLIFLALKCTPREMVNYRLSITNTTGWSMALVFYCLLIQPIPLFPAPAAKLGGPMVYYLGGMGQNYLVSHIVLTILMLLVTNLLAASIICFTVVCVFLLKTPTVSRPKGICICVGIHLVATGAATWFFTCVYGPAEGLKAELLSSHPELSALIHPHSILIGFHPVYTPSFLSATISIYLSLVAIIVLILYGLLIRQIWNGIRKTSHAETNRTRRTIVLMLTSRVAIPLVLGFAPVITVTAAMAFEVEMGLIFNCALLGTAMTHGLPNVLATMAVYRPYRYAIGNFLHRVLPHHISNRIGLEVAGRSMWSSGSQLEKYKNIHNPVVSIEVSNKY